MAPILRMVKTNDAAVDAWRNNYPQLQTLFDEVPGFNEFMLFILSGLLRDNKFGILFRVRYVKSSNFFGDFWATCEIGRDDTKTAPHGADSSGPGRGERESCSVI